MLTKEEYDVTMKSINDRFNMTLMALSIVHSHDELNLMIVGAWDHYRSNPSAIVSRCIVDAFVAVSVHHPLDTDPAIKAMRMRAILEEYISTIHKEVDWEGFNKKQQEAANG